MPETEKQEGQKTVVAFIAGLLIGGLLVWVFSSSPDTAEVNLDATDDETEEVTDTEDDTQGQTTRNTTNTNSGQTATVRDAADSDSAARGNGRLEVNNQPAGTVVDISSLVYPHDAGWIAVRDVENGVPGLILGAARYNEADGLAPESVKLLRATKAGETYEVIFLTEDGNREFNLDGDMVVEGISATFTAQ